MQFGLDKKIGLENLPLGKNHVNLFYYLKKNELIKSILNYIFSVPIRASSKANLLVS